LKLCNISLINELGIIDLAIKNNDAEMKFTVGLMPECVQYKGQYNSTEQ
jgi:hypothetical protein